MKLKEHLPSKTTIKHLMGFGIGMATIWNFGNNKHLEEINKLKSEINMTKTELKISQNYIKQLPNWDSTKFYDWSGGYESRSKWQMAIDDLKENYIPKDSCSFIQR